MMTDKDVEQDQRIARNEKAIQRQTEVLEKICAHYYPHMPWWKKAFAFLAKVVCVIVAYLGIAQTVDWLWNVRESEALAARYAGIARRLYMEQGDLTGAVSCLEKAIEFDSNKSAYRMSLKFLKGMSLVSDYIDNERPPTDVEQARIDAALSDAIVMRELEPENPKSYILMAQAYVLSGERDEAVFAIDRAVALAPDQAQVRVSACAINHFVGRVAEARAHLKEAERLNPELPLLFAWKGIFALADDHDATTARARFEETVRRVPRTALAHLYLGRALLAEKNPDFEQARAAFGKALVLDAKLTGALQGIAESHEREGNLVLARLWLDRALVVDANFLPSLVARARVNCKEGDYASAVADLTTAIALAPLRADLYQLRAEAHEKAADAVRAARDRKTASALTCDRRPETRSRL